MRGLLVSVAGRAVAGPVVIGPVVIAKAVVADSGTSAEQMFAGSENFSAASLDHNRELGIRTTSKPVITAVAAVLAADYAGATPAS